jgi:hypothetical protein
MTFDIRPDVAVAMLFVEYIIIPLMRATPSDSACQL